MDGRMREQLGRCQALVARIEEHAGDLGVLRDAELRQAAVSVRARLAGSAPDSVVPEAFAVASEACRRVTGERPVAVQFVAGAALHFGMVADVKDGEGKRVTTLLAAMVDAYAGRDVHVVSVNDYLARRDAEWARPIGELGALAVGLVAADLDATRRRDAYRAEVTYGSSSAFAHDYLRDTLAEETAAVVQRGQDCAFIDDIDSLLVDDGSIDYTISAPAEEDGSWPREAARLARILRSGPHYDIHPRSTAISFTDEGVRLLGDQLGGDFHRDDAVVHEIRAALIAKDLYRRGVHYDVDDGRIVVLHYATGTALGGRRVGGRIRRALEAKEGLPVGTLSPKLARTKARGYFRRYRKLAGLSGSAMPVASEFTQMYGLDTVEVPTHRPIVRVDHDDRLFRDDAQMYDAVLAAVLERHETGQPVIVAAAAARDAARVRRELAGADVPHRVADGHDHERDAAVIADAGRVGAVTLVTEQAGRGSHTVLDGIAVLGVGRHQSRRHDDRLRGLAGRNGTAGECTFFLSWNELAEWAGPYADPLRDQETELFPESVSEISAPAALVTELQTELEATGINNRLHLAQYDDVWDDQYRQWSVLRRLVVEGAFSGDGFLDLVHDVVGELIADHHVGSVPLDTPGLDAVLAGAVAELYPTTLSRRRFRRGIENATIISDLRDDAKRAYHRRCVQVAEDSGLGPEVIPRLQRTVLLSAYDGQWRLYVAKMEILYDDIEARILEDSDRLSDFRREAANLFQRTQHNIRRKAVKSFFHATVGPSDD